jgi:hypothetical protein
MGRGGQEAGKMPTKRTRVIHQRKNLSNTQLFSASDGLWGDPESIHRFEKFTFGFPTVRPDECRDVWLAIRDELLPKWIKERPGTRPSWWFLFDPECPRVSAEDIKRHGWGGWYFIELTPDLRRRLGGTGDPAYEHSALAPDFNCGIPDQFVTVEDVEWHRAEGEDFSGTPIDPNDPPAYESQATYLDRHDLLIPAERRRLRKKDFEPEIVRFPAQAEGNETQRALKAVFQAGRRE